MEVIFRHGKGVDKLGFSVVFDITQEDISLCLQRHDSPARIGLAGGGFNSLPQVLLDDIRGKLIGTEKRGVHRFYILLERFCHRFWLLSGVIWVLDKGVDVLDIGSVEVVDEGGHSCT